MLISVFDTEIPDIPEYAGKKFDAEFLGGKGHGLWWMQQQGVNVPPALIIPTTMCVEYMKKPKTVMKDIAKQYANIEKFFKGKFGYMPLLSVRSGARVSMPGMMDTILNVGLDNSTEEFWKGKIGPVACADSLHRLITMYGNVVHGLPRHELEKDDVISALEFYEKMAGPFPNAKDQVLGAIEAVFKSWNNDRAKFYRKMHDIPEDWGTAVVVQAMVFGNLNDNSCTGVMFTRNPDNGDGKVVGEFLVNAQGEDVVAGIRTPQNLSEMSNWDDEVFQEVLEVALKLENAKRDVQDIEFTVQDGKLFVLQTRNAKRSARAAVKIAVEMMVEGLITKEEMAKRVTMKELDLAQQSILDPAFTDKEDFTGIPACSGVVTGMVVLSAQAAINCKEPCIMVTQETTPDDIAGMNAAKAVLTMTGGSTSHAAVVARGMNKPCVVGLSVDIKKFKDGQIISIDGATGRVWFGKVPVIDGSSNPFVLQFKDACWQVYNDGNSAIIVDRPKPLKVQVVRMADKVTHHWAETLKELSEVGEKADQIILDFSARHPVEAKFYSMFVSSERLDQLIDGLVKHLEGSPVAGKLSILGGKISQKLPCLPVTKALEDLIMAEAEVIWAGDSTPAAAKVLKWKAQEGVKFSAIGVPSEGGMSYVSESQMLGSLLK